MNFEIEETQIKGFEWTCPECGKVITATSDKRVKSLAIQHWYTKHD